MTDYLAELRDRFAVAFASSNVSPVDVWKHADEVMKRRGNEPIADHNATKRYRASVFDTKDAREHYPPGDKARLDAFQDGWSVICDSDGIWRVRAPSKRGAYFLGIGPTIRAAIDDALRKSND